MLSHISLCLRKFCRLLYNVKCELTYYIHYSIDKALILKAQSLNMLIIFLAQHSENKQFNLLNTFFSSLTFSSNISHLFKP